MIKDLLVGKSAKERAEIKAFHLAKLKFAGDFQDSQYGIQMEIRGIRQIAGGVELMARAWKNGKQLGFGKDGTTEIERFKFFNPPILVDDPNGDIVKEWIDQRTQELRRRILREDPMEAVRQTLAHTIKVSGQENGQIIRGSIGNTTSTFYSGSGDGNVYHEDNSWSTVRGAATGTTADTTALFNTAGTFSTATPRYYIYRTFLPFDTVSIPDTDTIDSATLSFKIESDFLNGKGIGVVQTDQPSNTALTTSDYNNCGALDSAAEGATRITSVVDEAFSDMTLNATGLTWVIKTDFSKFGLRGEHDLDNTTPATNANQYINLYYSETTGTDSDPKLVVVHSAAVTSIPNRIYQLNQAVNRANTY